MLDKTVLKLSMYLAILTLLVGFWQWDRKGAYDGGYNAGKAEQLQASIDAAAKSAEALDAAKADRDKWEKIAIELQGRPPKKVKVYVEKIIEHNPDCTELHGFMELWNQYAD
jgi:hypothetical protein